MAVSTSSIGSGRLLHLNQRPLSTRAVPPSFIPYRPAVSTSRTHTTVSCSSAAASSAELSDATPSGSRGPDRTAVRLGLPSKGRMAEETLNLLKNCQLSVRQVNPRQYVADIPQIANLEVWYQRPKDIARKLRSGDLDLGIVGFDTLSEYGEGLFTLILFQTGCSEDGPVLKEIHSLMRESCCLLLKQIGCLLTRLVVDTGRVAVVAEAEEVGALNVSSWLTFMESLCATSDEKVLEEGVGGGGFFIHLLLGPIIGRRILRHTIYTGGNV